MQSPRLVLSSTSQSDNVVINVINNIFEATIYEDWKYFEINKTNIPKIDPVVLYHLDIILIDVGNSILYIIISEKK